jgi:hypothetical protein
MRRKFAPHIVRVIVNRKQFEGPEPPRIRRNLPLFSGHTHHAETHSSQTKRMARLLVDR